MLWFTADTHFGHTNIMRYCHRPFDNVGDMDDEIIERWNKVVKPGDAVYHLGDFAFTRSAKEAGLIARTLNGQIHLILGNHDRSAVRKAAGFAWMGDYKYIHVGDITIVMFHFPLRTWHKSHFGSWHLYGHHHGSLDERLGVPSFDVGVDVWNFTPVSFKQVEEQMKKRTEAYPNPPLLQRN